MYNPLEKYLKEYFTPTCDDYCLGDQGGAECFTKAVLQYINLSASLNTYYGN
jgi:hypothetical protein